MKSESKKNQPASPHKTDCIALRGAPDCNCHRIPAFKAEPVTMSFWLNFQKGGAA